MNLSPSAFNNLLAGIGQQYAWRKSFACPCRSANSGAARPNCPNCKGKGVFWDAPVTGVAGVASQKTQKNWANAGRYEMGDSVMVVGSDTALYQAGQFDRVLMLNATDEFSTTMVLGDNDTFHFPVVSIKRVFWLVAGSAIVEGVLPTVDAAGVLTWPLDPDTLVSLAPPAGTQYSISGSKLNEYFIYDNMPSDRNEHSGEALPKNIVLRRFDLFGR